MKTATAYFDIIQKSRDDDGHLLVYGKVTDSSLDIDSQICDETWLRAAMPAWFKWGNIREQHSSIAAGVATEYEARDDGHYIEAKIIDPGSAKKVEEGVLKGFSVGIKSPRIAKDNKARGGRIIGGEIVEVSLVDRPANENCKLVLAKAADAFEGLVATEELLEPCPALVDIEKGGVSHAHKHTHDDSAHQHDHDPGLPPEPHYHGHLHPQEHDTDVPDTNLDADADLEKRDFTDEKRQELADKGHALPDGSFPIENVGDLKNAIKAHGRASNKARAKAHIKRRARALGRTDLIPDEWKTVVADALKGHDDDDPEEWCEEILEYLEILTAKEMAEAQLYGRDESDSLKALRAAAAAMQAYMTTEADEWEKTVTLPTNNSTSTTNPGTAYVTSTSVTSVQGVGVDAPSPLDSMLTALKSATPEQLIDLRGIFAPEATEGTEASGGSEATKALEATVADLRERLATVEQMAAPGGPARVGSKALNPSKPVDETRQKIAYLRSQADQIPGTETAKGYRQLADELEASLT